jgi:ribulose-phosphate 3-epimerase
VKEKKIAASILTADFGNLQRDLKELEKTSVDIIHFDVMDGHFVPNISFGSGLIQALKSSLNSVFDVHLMITEPEKYLDSFIKAGADWISFHLEVTGESQARKICQKLKRKKIKAGIAISPKTPVQNIFPLLNEIDFIVIMSVEPGFGGQEIIPESFSKIAALKEILLQKKLPIQIEVDGGVKKENIGELAKIGADILIAGSAIFHPKQKIKKAAEDLEKAMTSF